MHSFWRSGYSAAYPLLPVRVSPFKGNKVETKRLLRIRRNSMDLSNRPPKSSKRTVTDHTYSRAFWKYSVSHGLLKSFLLTAECTGLYIQLVHPKHHDHFLIKQLQNY